MSDKTETVKLAREEQLELQVYVERSTRLTLQAQQLIVEAEKLRTAFQVKSEQLLKLYVPEGGVPVALDVEKGELQYSMKE